MDRPTDPRIDRPTDGRTDPLIEIHGRIIKQKLAVVTGPFKSLRAKSNTFPLISGHPRFFNQLSSGYDLISICGDWLATLVNVNMFTYEVNPVLLHAPPCSFKLLRAPSWSFLLLSAPFCSFMLHALGTTFSPLYSLSLFLLC